METPGILIVEDESITAMDIELILKDHGYNVLGIVSSGEDAVKIAAELRPDLVLMDIILNGDIDGIKAAKSILALEIPVIYLTAHSDKATILRAKENPASGYIIKPIDSKKLCNTIDITLQRHGKYLNELDEIESLSTDFQRKRGIHLNGTHPRPITLIPELLEPYPQNKNGDIDVETDKGNQKPVIMVVEDEEITALDLKLKLENLGYSVPATVNSGELAIQKALTIHPDLILMDIVLAGEIDGITAAQTIKDLGIPIVYLTAYTDGETVKRARYTSPYGYLIKPFEDGELYATIEMALSKHKSDTESIIKAKNKIKEKSDELKIEKTGVFFVSSVIISLAAYGLITRSMTWLEYLLFIPAMYGVMLALVSLKKQSPPVPFDELPLVSIMVPAHNEEYTINRCVKTLSKLDYHVEGKPNYEIVVINDGSTDKTGEILNRLKNEYESLRIVTRKPPRSGKGKGYVLNDGLEVCNGEIVAVFDADARVGPDFLKIIIPYLNEDGVEGVQARVRMYNRDENILTAMQELEFAVFGNVILRAKDIMGKNAFLGGNGQIATKRAIKEIGGWDGVAVTEDLNMSIKLIMDGYKIRYCGDAVVYQEAVPQWNLFFRQRVRWATGNLETLFVYLTKIMNAPIPLYKKIDSIEQLFFLLLIAFVMVGYIVAILQIGNVIQFHFGAPIVIAMLSTVAFLPSLIVGLYREKTLPHVIIYRSIEYWAYCLYLVPLFFTAFSQMIRRKERYWAKTHHTGQGDIDDREIADIGSPIDSGTPQPRK
ncbi:MAG TPA: response regulator [Methanobacterium sp.]|nr:response regulator [Methanobacterium sp.]